MNTVKTNQQQTYLQTTVDRLEYYLKNSSLRDSTITITNNTLVISFPSKDSGPNIPSDDQIRNIRGIVFWDSNIELLYVDNIFQYVHSQNYLRIDIRNYELMTSFFKTIKQFGITIYSFDMKDNEFCFNYKLSGRYHFTYDELNVLQNIINPNIKNHDSIRITGFDGIYTIRVTLKK